MNRPSRVPGQSAAVSYTHLVLTGADIFAEVLVEQGVETLLGYPGGAVLNLYDALYKYSGKIRHIMTAHEPVSYTHLDVYKRQYVASTTSAYRRAVNAYLDAPDAYMCPEDVLEELTRTCLLYTSHAYRPACGTGVEPGPAVH